MKHQIHLFSVVLLAMLFAPGAQAACPAGGITADVVVLDNPTLFNRLGAQNPNWITYALKRNVVEAKEIDQLGPDGLPTGNRLLVPGKPCTAGGNCSAGNVMLRPDMRPRPLVVRGIEGCNLTVTFTNWLQPTRQQGGATIGGANPNDPQQDNLNNNNQVAGRCAGFHASGTEIAAGGDISDDGSMTGNNPGGNKGDSTQGAPVCGPGMAEPNGTVTYNLYTPHEGAFIINSYGATLGSEAVSGNLGVGMFGALNVQPENSRMYRSKLSEEELRLATTGHTAMGQPIIDYEAAYPTGDADGNGTIDGTEVATAWDIEGKGGLPILNMLTPAGELVHSDIDAIIAGPNADYTFPASTYPLESVGNKNPALPNRLEPYREFTSIFHDEQSNSQVFPRWYGNPVLNYTLAGVKDAFMMNYGSGGIGSEIIANRLHTGPMHDCTGCAYEEFFLASQTVGDPGQLVKFPANSLIEQCDPTNILSPACWRQFTGTDVATGETIPIGANPPLNDPGADGMFGTADDVNNYALHPEDPSNVHHSYVGDKVKIRNTHVGAFEQHIFHLHNHQWLFNPNDDNANYLDAQEVMPGSGHTYELANGGVGNRNKTAGDAIFHCHFYPHFAQGMWYHIRIQDTFERGTVLAVSNANDPQNPTSGFHTGDADGDGLPDWAMQSGQPMAGARALPDGELPDGVPIPAVVPLPGQPMPAMPATVAVKPVDRGDFGVLSGRRAPNGLGQGPDSAQAVVDRAEVAGTDGVVGTADDKSPGYPFWLAGNECGPGATLINDVCDQGTVGQRMSTPPLDMLSQVGADEIANPTTGDPLFANATAAQAGGWDGGLPRHGIRGYTSGGVSLDTQNRLSFSKAVEIAQPVWFPETGTDLERTSMWHHANRCTDTFVQNGDGTVSPAKCDGSTPVKNMDGFGGFVQNGVLPVPGGPFQDPCIDDAGQALKDGIVGNWFDGDLAQDSLGVKGSSEYHGQNPRTYRVANVQIDAVFNKVGWHYPQERIISLWEDVAPTIAKQRPPEPLVMRFNTFDCGKILHTNLVPKEFELDDFQVRTPTDIIGQHIHLPKWDLTTNDGAANGWNYEDGALAPGMTIERIKAINNYNALAGGTHNLDDLLMTLGLWDKLPPDLQAAIDGSLLGGPGHIVDLTGLAAVPTLPADQLDPGSKVEPLATVLKPKPHPYFGSGVGGDCDAEPYGEYCGARTVIQRLMMDPLVNVEGVDRGLGLTFSHDHYGPSTFQQIGLYSTILAEPAGSTWVHNESGETLGNRPIAASDCTVNCTDGGPTSWQAVIRPPAEAPGGSTVQSESIPDHREFYFEMSDFQHAYEPGFYVAADAEGRPVKTTIDQPLFANVTEAYAPDLEDAWTFAINPPMKLKSVPFPDVVTAEAFCPGPLGNADPTVPRPCAEAINISHSSMFVTNYRNEPVGLRVFDPNKLGPDGRLGSQAGGINTLGVDVPMEAGDLAFALSSRTDRAIPQLNTSVGDSPYPTVAYCDDVDGAVGDGISCDRRPGDPFTPIMRAYEHDEVKVKIQVGATEEQHQTTIHGMKWLSNGSGFGRSPNSGWRNFQSHGISEQFSLQAPVVADNDNIGGMTDYLYASDATRDGFWTGAWGVLRTYANRRGDLVELTSNPVADSNATTVVTNDMVGVCPDVDPQDGIADNLVTFDVTVALANEILDNAIDLDGNGVPDITIPALTDVDPQFPTTTFGQQTVGGPLDPNGGTLVYNRRGTVVPTVEVPGEGAEGPVVLRGGEGPLNDPTAMMYVLTEDLVVRAERDAPAECFITRGRNAGQFDPLGECPDLVATGVINLDGCLDANGDFDPNLLTCPRALRAGAPVEPLVLRAEAGDCIEVTLNNRLPAVTPDLAGWMDMMWVVKRPELVDPVTGAKEMHFFNNNLIRPSGYAGMHTQLVEYDMSRHDGVLVGQNNLDNPDSVIASPLTGDENAENIVTYRWYAGDVASDVDISTTTRGKRTEVTRAITYTHTPVEFGAVNIVSADRVKQPQKGLFAALSILPAGSTVTQDTMVFDGQGTLDATRETRAQVTVDAGPPGAAGDRGVFRENLLVGHKIANIRWKDGTAIANVNQAEMGREGAEDYGFAGFNYGMEPSWFRFKLPPDVPFGNAGTPNSYGSIPNVQAMFANVLTIGEPNEVPAITGVSAAGDPQTPVFRVGKGVNSRIHVLNGASADRDGTFILHGHLWQRDPFVCPGENDLGLTGKCLTSAGTVDSTALGLNPVGKWMGGEEGMGHAYAHWPILFKAGGTNEIPGDYLFRDYAPNGSRNGQFGVLRVEEPTTP